MFNRQRREFSKFHGAGIADDLIRVGLLTEICSSMRGLVAPCVVSSDIADQVISYEFLRGLRPVLRFQASDQQRFFELGRKLAELHACPLPVSLPGRPFWGLHELIAFGLAEAEAELLVAEMPTGFFHGDCWHGNLFVRGEKFVILDPVPVGILFDQAPLAANGAFDLATLHMSLYARQPLMRYFCDIGLRVEDAATALLLGYLGKEKLPLLGPVIRKLSLALAGMWRDGLSGRLSPPVALLKRRMIQHAIGILSREGV